MTPQPETQPDPIDVVVGQMIKARRNMAGMSQVELGEAIGVSHQQIAKYETGDNRVAASTLVVLGNALNCPAAAFLPATPDACAAEGDIWPASAAQARDLLVSHQKIPVDLRRALLIVLKALAETA